MKTMIYSLPMLCLLAVTACSDEKFEGDVSKDWNGTANVIASTDEKAFLTYYQPAVGRVGDPMPFFDDNTGDFKVLYLQEYNNNDTYRYHPFWAVSTKDGAYYEPLGEILPTGNSASDQDAALGTGCCIYSAKEKLYYIYYTGHNPSCANTEVVMRATSPDFKTWTKDAEWTLKGTDHGFSAVDFRDPQIFEDNGKYHMIISTKNRFAEFTSDDLRNWTPAGSFSMVWDRMLECPDVFKMGDWWYLVYSEAYPASWSRKVKYMVARSFDELKACFSDPAANWPKDGHEGVLDSRGFYAGKTASDGTNRYIWGWNPFRTGISHYEKNVNVGAGGEPNWSGALVCHKIIQHEDGTLTLGEVPAIASKYNQKQTLQVMASSGANLQEGNGTLSGDSAYVLYNRLGNHNHISLTVTTSNNLDKFGISLFRGTDSQKYYTMVVNPESENVRKINFEEEGPAGKGFVEGIDGYNFVRPSDNVYNIDIYTDNSVMVMYINNVCAYTNRIYGIPKNCWSVNSYGGTIKVSNVEVSQY